MISKKLFRAMVFKISQVLCFTVSFSESYVLLLPLVSGFLLLIYLPHHHSPVFTSNIFYSSNFKISFFSHGSSCFMTYMHTQKLKSVGSMKESTPSALVRLDSCLLWFPVPSWPYAVTEKATKDDGDGQAKENIAAIGETWLCTWQQCPLIKMKRKLYGFTMTIMKQTCNNRAIYYRAI